MNSKVEDAICKYLSFNNFGFSCSRLSELELAILADDGEDPPGLSTSLTESRICNFNWLSNH